MSEMVLLFRVHLNYKKDAVAGEINNYRI